MVNKKTSSSKLGRGLDALLSDASLNTDIPNDADTDQVRNIPLEKIRPNQFQPRSNFDENALQELAESIQRHGVIQPIIVRSCVDNDPHVKYEIIVGERRWRSCQIAELATIPAVIRNSADDESREQALIENIQREDLNAIEQALALSELMQVYGLTQEKLAQRVGKSRSTVANLMRLNQLNEAVKQMVRQGKIEMGHARAVLAVAGPQQTKFAQRVIDKKMSVRATEQMIAAPQQKPETIVDRDIQELQERLTQSVGMPIRIHHHSSGKGMLQLKYSSADALQDIIILLERKGSADETN